MTTVAVQPVSGPVQPSVSGGYAGAGVSSPVTGAGGGGSTLSVNLGGLDLGYNLAANTSTLANQSQNFLLASFGADQAFLGQTIFGAQQFVNGLGAPLVGAAVATQTAANASLPGMYSRLLDNNFNLGMGAIAGQEATAQASIASSNAAANSGGCYITTAICGRLGLPDDCAVLRTFRRFRDSYMQQTPVGRKWVRQYYRDAPRIVAAIDARRDAGAVYDYLRGHYLVLALRAIARCDNATASMHYHAMVRDARCFAFGESYVTVQSMMRAA